MLLGYLPLFIASLPYNYKPRHLKKSFISWSFNSAVYTTNQDIPKVLFTNQETSKEFFFSFSIDIESSSLRNSLSYNKIDNDRIGNLWSPVVVMKFIKVLSYSAFLKWQWTHAQKEKNFSFFPGQTFRYFWLCVCLQILLRLNVKWETFYGSNTQSRLILSLRIKRKAKGELINFYCLRVSSFSQNYEMRGRRRIWRGWVGRDNNRKRSFFCV